MNVRHGSRAPSAQPARFRAFVSYSHADTAEARRLQKRLETYRLPRRLAERLAPFEGARDRIGPVFRDQEDLPASVDLSEAVKSAIAQSHALIILCSPDAARSHWVAREIELFRAIHPARPILAALVAGEPDQSFPPSLRAGGIEPLAADFRRAGDGPRLAFLKIVAGILDIPLDALIQRDAQRRQRRVMAVTVLSLALMLVFAAMTLLAISGRREAERQRGEAEQLVEYMLTDLRQRLKAVGSLDVMNDVNQRAMDYYRDQGPPDRLPDASLERRARIVGVMGEDAENGGDLDLAQSRYEALYRTTGALLAKNPGNPERVFAHAASENRLALLAFTRKRLVEATVRFRRTEHMLTSIELWGHDRADWLRLAGYVHGNIGATLLEQGHAGAEALRDWHQAVAYSERLAAIRPGDTSAAYDLIFHLLWLARAQSAAGQFGPVRDTQTRYLALLRTQVERNPNNMLVREQQMEVYAGHAKLLRAMGDRGAARRFLIEARVINERLIARDPDNAVWFKYRARIARLLEEES